MVDDLYRLFHWIAGPALLLAAVYTMWGERGALLGIGQALAAIIMVSWTLKAICI